MRKSAFSFLATAVAMLVLVPRASAIVILLSHPVTDPVTGYRYALLSQADWTDSEAKAVSLGGQLATIEDAEQQNFIFNLFGAYGGTQRILWTGLYDPTEDANGGNHADNFVWVSGAPVTYTDWDAGEPNDTDDSEFWVAMYYPNYNNPGSWDDWSDRTADPIGIQFDSVVEFVPEPATLGLLAPVLVLGLKRRARRSGF